MYSYNGARKRSLSNYNPVPFNLGVADFKIMLSYESDISPMLFTVFFPQLSYSGIYIAIRQSTCENAKRLTIETLENSIGNEPGTPSQHAYESR